MADQSFDELVATTLAALESGHRLRRRRAVRALDAVHVEIDGKPCVNFASNNYLGLTHHPRVIAAARAALESSGVGSGAAPLVSGYTETHAAAERAIAAWKGTDDAVLLPSGYQANHAAVGALAAAADAAGRGVRFLLDKLAHASLIDAVRAIGLPFRVFPHNGIGKLRRFLEEAEKGVIHIVVTESIFSMDGDAADLPALAELKREHPFVLLLDEAHASGVYGPAGAGYAAEVGLRDVVDVSIVTLSKALGCAGGAVCASRQICEAIVNFGRAYLYSTSMPAFAPAAAMAAIEVMRDEPARQRRVRELARRVRQRLSEVGLTMPPGDSPVIPIILGSETAALDAAARLMEQGILVVPIRPPSVPVGSSRLRVTVSCEHSDEEVARLIEHLISPVFPPGNAHPA
jgi:8-amino-7-oxononanoate synthase